MAFKSLNDRNEFGYMNRYRMLSTAGLVGSIGGGSISNFTITASGCGCATVNGDFTWNETNQQHEYYDETYSYTTSYAFYNSETGQWEMYGYDIDWMYYFDEVGLVCYSEDGSENEVPTTGWTMDSVYSGWYDPAPTITVS